MENPVAIFEFELLSRGFSKKTIQAYIFHLSRFLVQIDRPYHEVTKGDVKAYIAFLNRQGYSAATVNLALSAVKHFCSKVLKKKLKDIPCIRADIKLSPPLTMNEASGIIDAKANIRHRLMLEFLYSGLRAGECAGLMWENLLIEERLGIVRKGKGRKDRYFLLAERLIDDISEYRKIQPKGKRYIFNSRKSHVTVRCIEEVVSQAAKEAGITKKTTPHLLRVSFATHLLESGVPMSYIQALLGHSSIRTTQRYVRLSPKGLLHIKTPLDSL